MKQLKISETNMAFYGSDDHKKIRKMAAATEINWTGPPKAGGAPDLWIWRVENNQGGKSPFGIRPWPKKEYGKFFCGDSYIVLKTFRKGKSPKLSHDIFFWLGTSSSIDERGVAAYKTVELDDFLGGSAKQHRLIQGHESERFLRCFRYPPIVMAGGIASGFKHVETNAAKKKDGSKSAILRRIRKKGRRYIISQIPAKKSSLDAKDVFILDCGNTLYQYNGAQSSGFEKNRAQQECVKISKKRHKTSGIVVKHTHVHDGDDSKFWGILSTDADDDSGSSKIAASEESVKRRGAPPPPPVAADDDDDLLKPDDELLLRPDDDGGKTSVLHGDAFGGFTSADVQILRVSTDDEGMPKFEKILEGCMGDFSMDVLKSDGVFVVDSAMKDGDTVWIWTGQKADKEIKTEAMLMIEHYLSKSPFPNCPVTLLKETDNDLPLDFQKVFDEMGDAHDNASSSWVS
eukprot:g1382.t1